MKNPKTLMRIGVTGTVIAALCCFTPILVIVLAAAGFSAWAGYLDVVLLPMLAMFIGLTVYAVWQQQRIKDCCPPDGNGERP